MHSTPLYSKKHYVFDVLILVEEDTGHYSYTNPILVSTLRPRPSHSNGVLRSWPTSSVTLF